MRKASIVLVVVLLTAGLHAHVTVSPKEAVAGMVQRYTVRVPTEGTVSTVAVELEIPAGITVSNVPEGDGFTVTSRRDGGRIVAVTWTREIKPRESAEFAFVATNPIAAGEVRWKAHQRFADGTSTDWVGVAGERRPASITTIVPAK